MKKASYVASILLLIIVKLSAQVTEAEVYEYLGASLKRIGDRCVLDYDFRYPCFSPREGTSIEADIATSVIAKFILDHPAWQFEISHHADCRGDSGFNLQLSERLAQNFKIALLSEGVPEKQLISKGYGESKPINGCVCVELCNDQAYDENRRYELKVL